MPTFKIKRQYLLPLGNWLGGLALDGKKSRARTRFNRLIQEALQRLDSERKDLVNEYGEKDEDGKVKINKDEETGAENYVIPEEKKGEFLKEVSELYLQEAEITGPETLPLILTVREIVLNYSGDIAPEDADGYDRWCEAFEAFVVPAMPVAE